MKRIQIKSLRLVNFKGVRSLSIEMNSKKTEVFGANGSGKTTIFDAFTWLLFGKDSRDRKQFEIKTLDADGKPIQRLPHEVVGELLVDGELVSLTRRFCERWVKPRGQAEEVFAGHEEERFYNGVPCSVKEWGEKVAAICGETTFKMITSPSYFCTQKPDVQRAMLFRMAGEMTDSEFVGRYPAFEPFLKGLMGKSIEEYQREIAAKKRRVKAELDAIPQRIDERKRDTEGAETDFEGVEKELEEKKTALAEVEGRLTDVAKMVRAASQRRMKESKAVDDLKSRRAEIDYKICGDAMAEYRKRLGEKSDLEAKISRIDNALKSDEDSLESWREMIQRYKKTREELVTKWREIKAETLTFGEDAFNCPTCGRPLEMEDIERKQEEMREAFNARKSKSLEYNLEQGKENKRRMEVAQKSLETTEGIIRKSREEREKLVQELAAIGEVKIPDGKALVAENEEIKALNEEIARAEEKASQRQEEELPSTEELGEGKRILQEAIDELKAKLVLRDEVRRNAERVKELEKQQRAQADELAALERAEAEIQAFGRAKSLAVEWAVNEMFQMVRFKLFDTQINGQEVETCEAMVDGVPYSSLNNAGRINAGLDIINAICRYDGVCAPIFIDNCESITTPWETEGQQIRLYVADTPKMIIQ